jgi:hypothetical protein
LDGIPNVTVIAAKAIIVVIGPPTSEGNADLGQRREERFVQQFIPRPALKLSMKAFCMGLPGAM